MAWKSLPCCFVFLSVALLAQSNPVPFVNQPLQPTSASPGGGGFTMTVSGTGFVPGSVVRWNGKTRKSRLINSSRIAARILASDIAAAETASVSVVNPSPGGGASNAVFFQVASARTSVHFVTTEVPSSKQLESVVSGDFNHDGIMDVALTEVPTYNHDPSVEIFLGNGDGTFRSAGTYYAGISPNPLTAADFNHDGTLDLAVVSQAPDKVFILLGKGDGTFNPAVGYAAGSYPSAVAVGDFNRDGNLDMVVPNFESNTVSIFVGKGDGTFASQVTFAASVSPWALTVGDFNSDGILDLVIAGLTSSGHLAIMLGNGDGTFQPYIELACCNYHSIASADLNRDGKLDLAVGGTGSLSIFLGNGDGTFESAVSYSAGTNPVSLALGDFNADRKLDIAAADAFFPPSGVNLLLGNGDGTFQTPVNFPASNLTFAIAAGDFNGDGRLDLLTGNYDTYDVLLQ